ncbi:LytTR family DNA-binding domain-containing protein [Pontixanthobacter gangjinensis]|uniref:DNA-binding response regulator n=1 Tax=Christiangramia aestuarii TaxID=1028746 RepID=A0A7K1LP42_9FLAO|nr:LytTR family DNA-binding domain-containing protein [Christiangramia aestuarii]MUP42508.1 DNA-binding response regulator [Christiangramia aestuarii]
MAAEEKIIIVERDIPMAAKLSLQLYKLGYNITGIFSRAKDALHFMEQEVPDLILLDDQLKGQLNGIEALSAKSKLCSPIIYFNKQTAEAIDRLLPRSLKRRTKKLEAVADPAAENTETESEENLLNPDEHYIMNDRIFIRHHEKMIRLALDDIQYIEADRNYCKVFSRNKKYLLVTTLKEVDEKLSDNRFLRIHRSYIANISHIDEIGGNHVVICSHSLPLSKNMRAELFKHLRVI